ncbi:MAG: helix-turn-helix domain-containing protein [Planctomycetota bacterium]|nr:helix-turn-helix domain-containing protein [Planctomycetota bacterium]
MTIAEMLTELVKNGMRKEQLALELGVTSVTITNWANAVRLPKKLYRERIAEIYNKQKEGR